jgi:hypothetical protein
MPEGSSEHPAGVEAGEIATSTLAEIYAQQGLLGRALSIYRRMLSRTPEDPDISGRIRSLERRIAEAGPTSEERVSELEGERTRERLPWDPPAEESPAAAARPATGATDPLSPPRVGPMDSRAFETWLEGR